MADKENHPAATAKAKSAVKSIRVFNSGCGEQHTEHRYGTWMPRIWWVLTSRSWIPVALNYFLLEHRDGLVLFDTGLDPAIKSDPNYITHPIGRFLVGRIFRLHITDEDRMDRVLAAGGVAPQDISTAVFSHLHFDHVGGIAHIPQADLLVSAREWAQLDEPHPEYEWILREHIQIPDAKWQPFEFEATCDPLFEPFGGAYDVTGDGSMILLPTPGHTPGSLSMLVRSEGWVPILLIGDLSYEADLLMRDVVAGTGDAKGIRESYAKIRRLKEQLPDLVIVASHDTSAADVVARARRPGAPAGQPR